MNVIYIALPIALMLGAAGLWACIYSIRSGQYDDLESPQVRILLDDKDVDLDRPPGLDSKSATNSSQPTAENTPQKTTSDERDN